MISNHPGPWQQYHFRSDNKGLSIMELKSKYLHEQYLFEAELFNLQQQHQQNVFMNGGGGGPTSSSSTPTYTTALQLSFNNDLQTIESDFGFDPRNVSNWNSRFVNGGFETLTIDTTNTYAPIITLKGNDTNIEIDADAFQAKTTLLSLIDLYDNCINEIGPNCFENNSIIQNVTLNNVTIVGVTTFAGCGSLTSVRFDSLTTIPNAGDFNSGVFANCDLSGDNLGTMFPALVTIGNFAFYRTNIPTISSSTITTIGFRAFDNSTSLTSINLTNSVTFGNANGGRSFASCSGLNSITLPSICTFFGNNNNTFIDVANGGTAVVNNANINNASILYIKNTLGWSVNP
jgi:hypothetical protein